MILCTMSIVHSTVTTKLHVQVYNTTQLMKEKVLIKQWELSSKPIKP